MFDKATTAADLRNAALVMDHLGKTEDQYVDQDTASVCLDGAIRLATDFELITYDNGRFDCDLNDRGALRHQAALRALIPLLPTCCTAHDDHRGCGTLTWPELDGSYRVYHYSDHVCDGKDGAVDVLIEAAEKLEADL